jgi:hypothetical protein
MLASAGQELRFAPRRAATRYKARWIVDCKRLVCISDLESEIEQLYLRAIDLFRPAVMSSSFCRRGLLADPCRRRLSWHGFAERYGRSGSQISDPHDPAKPIEPPRRGPDSHALIA